MTERRLARYDRPRDIGDGRVQARGSSSPLYQQIYERLRRSILDGRLKPGDRLPSTRAYAAETGVARGTIDAAYGMLAGNGYIETLPRAGTVVARRAPREAIAIPPAGAARDDRERSWHPSTPLPLTPGIPALDLFPRTLWAQAVGRCARAMSATQMVYPDAAGSAPLRSAIATHLGVSRGIDCEPDQVVITGGFQSGLSLVMDEFTMPGQNVWLEDPGYPICGAAAARAQLHQVLIPVDREGLMVEPAIEAAADARLCVVTPAQQYPLGVAMSLPRRRALLDWAEARDAWIVEDDFDGEFRYDGRTLPALKSLDRADRVIYAGTFSKSLFPGLRLGYLVAPAQAADRLRRALRIAGGGRSIVDQSAVAEMLASGQFARHVHRMRLAYAARRQAMATALAAEFGRAARIDQSDGGLHLVLRIAGMGDRLRDFEPLRPDGLGTLALSRLSARTDLQDALLVGFANVPERRAPGLARQLADAVAKTAR